MLNQFQKLKSRTSKFKMTSEGTLNALFQSS